LPLSILVVVAIDFSRSTRILRDRNAPGVSLAFCRGFRRGFAQYSPCIRYKHPAVVKVE
jgi:hypothetical protein